MRLFFVGDQFGAKKLGYKGKLTRFLKPKRRSIFFDFPEKMTLLIHVNKLYYCQTSLLLDNH